MIVKGNTSKSWRIPWLLIIVAVVIAAVVYDYVVQAATADKIQANVIYCDAETVVGDMFTNAGHTFGNAASQSSDESRSGKYSCYLDGNNRYGLTHRLKEPGAAETYIARVWTKTDYPQHAYLVVKCSPDESTQVMTNTVVAWDNNGWVQLQAELTTPQKPLTEELLIFAYVNQDGASAYFDDLTIERYNPTKALDTLAQAIHLYLDDKALSKINRKRTEALKKGLLQTGDNDWVKVRLTANDSLEYDVKLRLKGDWTDHLTGDYWSYRVKMPSDRSWNRLMTFSLQDPKTRSYLSEWLFHQVLTDLDVITPRYGFVKLSQNEQEPVLYAYEEHFDKQVAEYRNRREGVILKYSEEAFWGERERNLGSQEINYYYHGEDDAEITAFKESKIAKNPKLLEQYNHGRGLLKAYQEQSLPVTEIFDVDRMAKLYAIAEVLESYHGLIWHNQRYYYNPITRKLEPIGFDGYTETGPYRIYNKLFFGEHKTGPDADPYYDQYIYLFRDETFNAAYTKHLLEYSSEEWILDMLSKYKDELINYTKLVQTTNPRYQFDTEFLINRAKRLRNNVRPYSDYSLVAFRGMDGRDVQLVNIANKHPLPLAVIGSGMSVDYPKSTLDEPVLLNSGPLKGAPQYSKINIPEGHKYLYFKMPGSPDLYSTAIKRWTSPAVPIVRYSSSGKLTIPLPADSYTLTDSVLTIQAGRHRLSSPMMIPQGHTLVIEPGTTIDLVNKAYILCYDNVLMYGTEDNPILITSTDRTAQGFVVSDASQPSLVTYTSFTNLNTLEENEWQLTGAVTFYESDVTLQHVTISDNSCEDALNLVRSEFEISHLNINNTFADGFDGDFCTGIIKDSYLYKTGNDGLDYSGSVVTVENVQLHQIGDKGISAGEEATLTLVNVDIDGAEIGVASKDLSLVTATDLKMSNCAQGFAAYRKKPEFGGGTIIVDSYSATNISKLVITDEESKITLPK